MFASYKWNVGRVLLLGLLAGTSVYARSTEVPQQIPKRSRDNLTVPIRGSHAAGPFYSGARSYELPSHAEYRLFDLFCSASDTEWFRPSQNISALALQRLAGPGSRAAMPARPRYRLRPC
jgi:hypothetical protein